MPGAGLSVRHLTMAFCRGREHVQALDDVSFDVPVGQAVALVGESGSGKSLTALTVLGLASALQGTILRGTAMFRGRDLLRLAEHELREVRGKHIALVPQDAVTSLDPVRAVGDQLVQILRTHGRRARARDRARELLELVGVPDPTEQLRAFPQHLSRGTRQRIVVAMALAHDPAVLIADEPTGALDASGQDHVLDLFGRLRDENGTGILLITRDLGLVAEFTQHVVVMYAGQVVETAPTTDLFTNAAHPYTRALLASVLAPRGASDHRLSTIEGTMPEPGHPVAGCRFADRCALCAERGKEADACRSQPPRPRDVAPNWTVRCHFAGDATS